MEIWEFIKGIDFFGKEPDIYIKGRQKHVTIIGRIFTYIFMILYIAIFSYKLYRMSQRVDITFYDSYSNSDEIPSIKITPENFTLVFTLFDGDGEPFIDDTIYYPEAYFYDEEYKEIRIERCDPSKLKSEFLEYLNYKNIDSYFCLNDINFELRPYMNSLRLEIYPCLDASEDDNYCESREFIDEYLSNTLLMVYIEDINLTPLNFTNPVKKKISSLNTEIFKNLGQYLHSQMQLVKIETGTNIIGFDFLTEPRVEEFIKFDKEVILPYPGYNLDDVDNTYPTTIFEIQLNDRILLEKRTYVQLIDVLGEIGGFMEIMSSLFAVICTVIVDMLYEKRITNNLFSFDIQKKLILIKDEKNSSFRIEEKKDMEEINIYSPNITSKTNKKIIKKRKKIIINSNNKNIHLDKDSSQKKETIEIKSLKNEIKDEKAELRSNKNSRDEINKKSEDYLNDISKKKKNDKNIEPNWSIDEITLKDLLISKFYCCSKNRTNVYKLILDESMKIIMEKLDILNIFRNQYFIEYFINDLKKNLNKMIMSKELSNELSEITKR